MKDNNQAFPVENSHYVTTKAGMTLRDYFAAKAMQSYLTHEQGANQIVDVVAGWAYEMADAMLEVRSK